MSDDEKKVSGEQPEGGVPTPTFSEAPVSPPSALTPEAITALSQALLPQIEEVIERKIQGTKDKRFGRLEKTEGTLKEVLASLKSSGVAIPAEVERDYALRDYIDQRLAERGVPSQADGGTSASGGVEAGKFDAISVIKQFNLDSGDPEVAILLKGNYRNPDHFRAEAASLALRKASKPVTSSTPTPLPGETPPQAGADALMAEYRTKIEQAKLAPDKIRAITNLQIEYRKKGLKV